MWRSDCTRGEVIGASFAATRGFYEMVDTLAKEIPGFQWENCSGGGRIKDYGAMRRAVKIFNSDTYSPLHVRQAFYDSSYAFHPMQLEGHLGSTDGRLSSAGRRRHEVRVPLDVAGRPGMVPRRAQRRQRQRAVDARRRRTPSRPASTRTRPSSGPWSARPICITSCPVPTAATGTASSTTTRPPGKAWSICSSRPPSPPRETIRFKGLDAKQMYRVSFEDGTQPPSVKSAAELMDQGLPVTLARRGGVGTDLLRGRAVSCQGEGPEKTRA